MTVSLAQDFRPSNLSDVLGNERHIKAIQNMAKTGQFPGAFLLGGPAGVGKTTLARVIAKILTCKNRDGHVVCGTCEGCRGVDNLGGANFYYLDGGAKNMSDLIREELIPFFQSRPTLGVSHKVLILDEFQRVTDAAKSLLLAPLEELPTQYPWVVALFTTTTPEDIDHALRTRCAQIRFAPLDPEVMVEGVLKFRPELAEAKESIRLLAERSDGCMRQLWVYIQQQDFFGEPLTPELAAWMVGDVPSEERHKLWTFTEGGQVDKALKLWDGWVKKGANPEQLGERFVEDTVVQISLKPDSGPWLNNLDLLSEIALKGKPSHWRWAIARLTPAPFRKADPVLTEREETPTLTPPTPPVLPEREEPAPEPTDNVVPFRPRRTLEEITAEVNQNVVVVNPAETVRKAFLGTNALDPQDDPWGIDFEPEPVPESVKTVDLLDLKAVFEACYG